MKSLLVLFLASITPVALAQPFKCGTSTVTDADGNIYHTVQIGGQCWMKENMRTTRYPDGKLIRIPEPPDVYIYVNKPGITQVYVNSSVKDDVRIRIINLQGKIVFQDEKSAVLGTNLLKFHIGLTGFYILEVNNTRFKVVGDSQLGISLELQNIEPVLNISGDCSVFTDSSICVFDYDNDPGISSEYGKLYSYKAALNIKTANPINQIYQGICPDGWHVANDSDWMRLEQKAGMSLNEVTDFGKYRGVVANKLRALGPAYWVRPSGTDDFGFSARGSGFYFCQNENECNFHDFNLNATWWTYNNWYIMLRQITDVDVGIYRGNYFTYKVGTAYSVRCIMDQGAP
jgi:uncharacterized protein (TIGR02145 family)